MNSFLASTVGRVIGALAFLSVALVVILWLRGDDAEQSKQVARSAKASVEAAHEAAQTVIDRAEADSSVDSLVAETARQIDNLPPAEAAQAARTAICSLPEYKDAPECGN